MSHSLLPPHSADLTTEALSALASFLEGRRFVALTGAGLSTASGIPDYRGPESRKRERRPMQYKTFVESEAARARYWARSAVGWPRFSSMQPNDGHHALATLEQAGLLRGVITQNVDRLHTKAGGERVVELHGTLSQVQCLACSRFEDRDSFQQRLLAHNAGWEATPSEFAPDGDAELEAAQLASFQVPDCLFCGGVLKPYVVFFGENVPKATVADAWDLLEDGEALVVLGSSLTVYSGYRFVLGAVKRDIPVAIVNVGETRGDEHASLLLQARIDLLLPRLVNRLIPLGL